MNIPADHRAIVAVDLGAQSCRISLLRWRSSSGSTFGAPRIELIHRISNGPVDRNGSLRWDLVSITAAADEGLRRCAAVAEEGIAAIGVTGWAVDTVRLQAGGEKARSTPIAEPYCYRDSRTGAAMEAVHRRISASRLYALTGIQVLSFNTIYQLYADGMAGTPANLPWLNLPEYMLYRWGARPVAEYTNATATGMVELGTMRWSEEIFAAASLDRGAAPEIVPPGSIVGRIQGALAELPALRDTLLIAPACHDTAAAIAGIPARGKNWAYISSGTWSLVGTLLEKPCVGGDAAQLNFTNEGGVGGRFCFLRNVNGLWLLMQCMESWKAAGERRSLASLIEAAAELPAPKVLLDVDDPDLLAPGDMPEKIAAQLERKKAVPAEIRKSRPAMVGLILHSLAARYARVLKDAMLLTGIEFERLYVVGGGSRNLLLNRLTEEATGLPLIVGEPESSTIGNFSVQLATLEQMQNDGARQNGVEHDAVARWAAVLSSPPSNSPVPAAARPGYTTQSVGEDD